jgi:hypothetical protein
MLRTAGGALASSRVPAFGKIVVFNRSVRRTVASETLRTLGG